MAVDRKIQSDAPRSRLLGTGEPAKQKRRPISDGELLAMARAGLWMRAARIEAGITQEDPLGGAVNQARVFMSKIEAGKARLTAPYYTAWAVAVGVGPTEVAQAMIGFYTPFLYEPLFGVPFESKPPTRVVREAESNAAGARLRLLRKQAGVSQIELGTAIGVSARKISTYEDGSVLIPTKYLSKLADHLGVSRQELQPREGKP